jgi:hypothetical protein
MKTRLDERSTLLASLVLLGGCLLWAQWPALTTMVDRWSHDPRYAHGYFVPLFALALLGMRRAPADGSAVSILAKKRIERAHGSPGTPSTRKSR